MKIVSSKQIKFLISNMFEKYYEPIQAEVSESGLAEEFGHKVIQDILATIYRRSMDDGIETEEELDELAVGIINEHLERVLVPYYAQEYVDKFSIDKVALENGMLNMIQENNNTPEQEQGEFVEDGEDESGKAEKTENLEKAENLENAETVEALFLYDVADEDVEVIDFRAARQENSVVRRIEEPRIRRFRINWMLTVGASLLVALVLWFVVGMLMGRGILPRVDMGYTWFNSHIWSVF